MYCFGYLCFVFDYCLKYPTSDCELNKTTKFYDPPDDYDNIVHQMYESTVRLRAPNSTPTIADDKNVNIIPKTDHGDWILRYSDSETDFHPWNSKSKFSHFDLVPWRTQKSRIDLFHTAGWERQNDDCDKEMQKRIAKIEKQFAKRLIRQHRLHEKRIKRHSIQIRILFSIEFKKRRKMRRNSFIKSNNVVLSAKSSRQIFIFDQRQIRMNEHWGYFSQRYKGVEELTVENQVVQASHYDRFDYRNMFPRIGELCSQQYSRSVFKQVPCAQCQRYVPFLTFLKTIEFFLIRYIFKNETFMMMQSQRLDPL